MPFTNRIRLPFKLTRPQFPEDRSIYRKANGETKILSVTVKKTYEGETDWLPEKWHQRLAIALGHDNITIEGDKYFGGVAKDGDYEIDWQTFLDYPTAKAKFSVQVTPFDNTNSNCQTCEEATQLSLENDTFPDPLEESQSYEINVADNDNICCYPARFSIVSFDTNYIASASIDQEGNLTVNMADSFITANGLTLLTYRVTCPNGGFDEAQVIGDTSGTEVACNAPTNLVVTSTTSSGAEIDFTAAVPTPDHYFWRLYKTSAAPAVLVQSGESSIPHVSLTGLLPSQTYHFYIRSQCDDTNNDDPASNFVELDLLTAPASGTCGEYILNYLDPFGAPGAHADATYLDCSGVYQNLYVPNFVPRTICALQTSPGVPVYINSGGATVGHGTDSYCNAEPESINLFVGAILGLPGDTCSNVISVWIAADDIDIHTGVAVFTDSDLTTPLTGKSFIADSDGNVFNFSGGIVGSSTGISC